MKNKRGLSLAMSILAIATLTGCDDEYDYPDNNWKEGDIVTVGGKTYTFDEIYSLFEDTNTSAQAYYNVAKDILGQLVTPRSDPILASVDSRINELENTWKTNARTNSTSYKEEKEKTLESENVEDEDELREKYIAEEQNSQNSEDFYDINVDGTSAGKTDYTYYISEEQTKQYVIDQAPYHVSHILIQVDASGDGEGLWNGLISADDANQLGNVTRLLASSDTFGSIALITSDDSGSRAQYGELATTGSDGDQMIAMQKSTSYINEFKLGVYAYDAYLNPETKSEEINTSVRASLRVPGKEATSENYTYTNETDVSTLINNTLIGQSKAFGIPLSKAITLGYLSDLESNVINGAKVDYASETQYPRNIIYNNYFNYHGVNFMYDDSDEYDSDFITSAIEVANAAKDTDTASTLKTYLDASNTTEALSLVESKYPEKYEEYVYVKGQLSRIDENKFQTVEGVSDSLYEYTTTITEESWGASSTTKLTPISGSKKVLVEKNDGSKNPVIIVRGGTSDYQGIHFIVVNKDPFVNSETAHEYYRTNIPSENAEASSPDTKNYEDNPSFINYINADLNTNTTYNARRDAIASVIRSSDSNIDFKLYENNVKTFNANQNLNGGKTWDEVLGEYASIIEKYISLTRENATLTAEESLDESWETYIKKLALQEEVSPRGIVPEVCVSTFEGGNFDGKESLCHVEK